MHHTKERVSAAEVSGVDRRASAPPDRSSLFRSMDATPQSSPADEPDSIRNREGCCAEHRVAFWSGLRVGRGSRRRRALSLDQISNGSAEARTLLPVADSLEKGTARPSERTSVAPPERPDNAAGLLDELIWTLLTSRLPHRVRSQRGCFKLRLLRSDDFAIGMVRSNLGGSVPPSM